MRQYYRVCLCVRVYVYPKLSFLFGYTLIGACCRKKVLETSCLLTQRRLPNSLFGPLTMPIELAGHSALVTRDTAPAAVELPDDKELEVLGYLSGWRRELKRVSSLVSGRSHVQSLIADVVVRSPLRDCCLQAKTQGRSGSEPSRQLGTRKEECERSALNSKKA